ncbi:DUF4326 domain-containing protein [Crocinitomicaceae bacterium]|nr:DUF4326 domain-containing protein [Crocinitomicaceae bacterium]
MARGRITIGTVWAPKDDAENIYIGRSSKHPSPLGNPYVITSAVSREEACAKYEVYLKERVKAKDKPILKELNRIANLVKKGKNVNLSCYCSHKGLQCHGLTIMHLVQNALDK